MSSSSKPRSATKSKKVSRTTRRKRKSTAFKPLLIGGHTVRVSFSEDLKDESGWPCYGLFDYDKRTIVLRAGMDRDLTVETLLHEIVEAINCIYELNMPHSKIQALGAGLHQMLDGHLTF